MIDTLKLFIPDYEIEDSQVFNINKGQERTIFDFKTGKNQVIDTGSKLLIKDKKGIERTGQKAFINTPFFQVDIQPFINGSPFMFLKMSIPKVYNNSDSNIYSSGQKGTLAALMKVEKDLSSIGIKADLLSSTPSRIDLFYIINDIYNYLYINQQKKIDNILTKDRNNNSKNMNTIFNK